MIWKMLTCAAIAALIAGCASTTDDAATQSVDDTDPDLSAPTCAPALAGGAVPKEQHAMLDTIAFTEGTAGSCGEDGYNTGYAFHCFSSCTHHPGIAWTAGGITSTAAGRYQFLSTTWSRLGLGSFVPSHQDIGAMMLIEERGVSLPTTRALTATEFANAMKKLSLEWASLPYSPYGQPTVSLAKARAKYCSFAGCSTADADE